MTEPGHVVAKGSYLERGSSSRRIIWVVLSYEEKTHLLWLLLI